MAVDEFGREIPAPAIVGVSESNNTTSIVEGAGAPLSSYSGYGGGVDVGSGGGNLRPVDVAAAVRRRTNSSELPSSTSLPTALASSSQQQQHQPSNYSNIHHHYQRGNYQNHQQPQHYNSSSNNNNNRSYYGHGGQHHHHPRSNSNDFHRGGSGGGGGYTNPSSRNHYLSAPVTSLLPLKGGEHHHNSNIHSSAGSKSDAMTTSTKNNASSSLTHSSQYKAHPSFQYVQEPVLCGFVWKSSELATEALKTYTKENPTLVPPGDSINNNDSNKSNVTGEEGGDDSATNQHDTESNENSNNNTFSTNDSLSNNDIVMAMLYDKYRKHYCLNYVRSFFNKHLDDSWFRQRFSPSVRKRTIYEPEQARAISEARALVSLVTTAAKQQQLTSNTTAATAFWNQFRLGHGMKQQLLLPPKGGGAAAATSLTSSPRRQGLGSPLSSEVGDNSQQSSQSVLAVNVPPIQQLFSFQQQQSQNSITDPKEVAQPKQKGNASAVTTRTVGLHVVDIPSHVTDEHVALALVDQYNTVAMAKHEQQVADLQKASAGDSSSAAVPAEGGTSGSNKNNPTGTIGSVPKKGAKPVVTLPTPTLLKVSEIKVYPAPATLISDGPPSIVMHRQVLAIGPADFFVEILVSLKHQQETKTSEAVTSSSTTTTTAGVPPNKRLVPRKGGGIDTELTFWSHPEAFHGPFDLDVECSDPYGRLDYDADGRGGAPADNQTVTPRKSIVGISPVHIFSPNNSNNNASGNSGGSSVDLATANLRKQPQAQSHFGQQQQDFRHNAPTQHPFATQIVVLSAAVSSKTRIDDDLKSAQTLARALDAKKRIPVGLRLQDIIEQNNLTGTNDDNGVSSEDILDLSIAYLRRVHLLSYYNGCSEAETIGDVMAGKHPAGTIHLRLQNADDYVNSKKLSNKESTTTTTTTKVESTEDPADENIKEEETLVQPNEELKKDMLVQRLDDSISKALDYYQKWLGKNSDDVEDDEDHYDEQDVPGMMDERIEGESKEIEALEDVVKGKWVDDHCIIDDDGRARCSFRFCHKLFRDASFLEKHLLKKHCEFLHAEQAKCHDQYMMAAWDACVCRPVPPVLVDCGTHFGCVAANIMSGQTEPDIIDPEPVLWQNVEKARVREMEMKQKREELRQQQLNSSANSHSYNHKERGIGSPDDVHHNAPQPRRSFFVDVDDMKEEKVELSFDNIDIDAVALINAKKKKKKRKLL
jgi:SERRATE/Ars2, N-terminal domain